MERVKFVGKYVDKNLVKEYDELSFQIKYGFRKCTNLLEERAKERAPLIDEMRQKPRRRERKE